VCLHSTPGTSQFDAEYQVALAASESRQPDQSPNAKTSQTLKWLCRRYFQSADYKELDLGTQRTRLLIVEHMWNEPILPGSAVLIGDCPLDRLSSKIVRVLRDRKASHPNAANSRVKVIRRIFKWAVENELMPSNPAREVSYLRTRSGGYHTLTEAELRQFEERWPVGTKERLAFTLLRYLGVRRSDVVRLGKQHATRKGWLRFTQYKNRNRKPITLEIPILPVLQAEIDAAPTGDLTFLITDYGRPFSIPGFGNKMRQWCNEAGLPQCSAHGLRKAGARAAENGATAHQLMSIFGWLTLAEAERYTKAVRQSVMAGEAMEMLSRTKEG
jgi:integrase